MGSLSIISNWYGGYKILGIFLKRQINRIRSCITECSGAGAWSKPQCIEKMFGILSFLRFSGNIRIEPCKENEFSFFETVCLSKIRLNRSYTLLYMNDRIWFGKWRYWKAGAHRKFWDFSLGEDEEIPCLIPTRIYGTLNFVGMEDLLRNALGWRWGPAFPGFWNALVIQELRRVFA